MQPGSVARLGVPDLELTISLQLIVHSAAILSSAAMHPSVVVISEENLRVKWYVPLDGKMMLKKQFVKLVKMLETRSSLRDARGSRRLDL